MLDSLGDEGFSWATRRRETRLGNEGHSGLTTGRRTHLGDERFSWATNYPGGWRLQDYPGGQGMSLSSYVGGWGDSPGRQRILLGDGDLLEGRVILVMDDGFWRDKGFSWGQGILHGQLHNTHRDRQYR